MKIAVFSPVVIARAAKQILPNTSNVPAYAICCACHPQAFFPAIKKVRETVR